ncbi:hypothetical protein [Alkalihalobacillus sp. AL-G]|uniref:hypothetical protein n=1 Tax=Alkalihalobacillus sp. AL-G TaxID=2926399 RepID=UPI00272C41BE|nr:hypothetical protein [Alkalihalobacillus sp. AL-G]WLD94802.1 hypothetical protein MOJ78_07945 [Alkalihalobacillus sp. AL-G]
METEQLIGTLNNWVSQQLLIQKEEMNDLDETFLTLEDVRYKPQPRDTEDYMEGNTLQLSGEGLILEGQMTASLPYESYDIPLEGLENVMIAEDNLSFDTARGRYRIAFKR